MAQILHTPWSLLWNSWSCAENPSKTKKKLITLVHSLSVKDDWLWMVGTADAFDDERLDEKQRVSSWQWSAYGLQRMLDVEAYYR